jgi:hypothetical protein
MVRGDAVLARPGAHFSTGKQKELKQQVAFFKWVRVSAVSAAAMAFTLLVGLASPLQIAGASSPSIGSVSAQSVIAQPANSASAEIQWVAPNPPPAGWRVVGKDLNTGRRSTATCWACSHYRMGSLVVGDPYSFTVQPVTSSGSLTGLATGSNRVSIGNDAMPNPLKSVTLTANPDQSVTVTWRLSSTGQAADTVSFAAYNLSTNQSFGSVSYYDAYRHSLTVPAVLGNVEFLGWARNSAGTPASTVSNAVTVISSCASSDICLHVQTNNALGTESLTTQGFLHGTGDPYNSSVQPNYSLVNALHPRQFRESMPNFINNVQTYNAQATANGQPDPASLIVILSDLWTQHTASANGGYAAAPWNSSTYNWSAYSSWVTSVISWAKQNLTTQPYWDIMNEPDGIQANGYYSPSDTASVTQANLNSTIFKLFLVTFQAIKAADPNAKVMGPSMTIFNDIPSIDDKTLLFDNRDWVQFAAANSIRIDAFSWHDENDNQAPTNWAEAGAPWNFADHVARARDLLAQYPAIGNPIIVVNEYGMAENSLVPGWDPGWAQVMEDAQIAQADRSCWSWSVCDTPDIGGRLARDSSGTYSATLPVYWADAAYGAMYGRQRVNMATSSAWRISGVAVRDDATGTISVLAGHHAGCSAAFGYNCPTGAWTDAPASTTVTMDWPYPSTSATVTVDQIPNGTSPIPGPVQISSSSVPVVNGQITAAIPSFADGDAYTVTAASN